MPTDAGKRLLAWWRTGDEPNYRGIARRVRDIENEAYTQGHVDAVTEYRLTEAEAVAKALDAVHARVRLTLIGGDTEQRYTPTEVSALVGDAIAEVRVLAIIDGADDEIGAAIRQMSDPLPIPADSTFYERETDDD